MPLAGDIEARAIEAGNYVVVTCRVPRDSCALRLPNISPDDACVWIVKVNAVSFTDIVPGGDQRIVMRGPLLYNSTKDISKPFAVTRKSYTMTVETINVLEVYEDANLTTLTAVDITHLEAVMRAVLAQIT